MIIRYGGDSIEITPGAKKGKASVILPIPVLGNTDEESMPLISPVYRKKGSFHIWKDQELYFGLTSLPARERFDRELALERYLELFELIGPDFLYRTWNYLPQLNVGEGDQERYKQFCESRSEAFHQSYKSREFSFMPAGTCVGIEGDDAVICFLAGPTCPDHHENPNQVPAYHYPRQYGPRSPCFARASCVHCGEKQYRFISGTAAVVGHESQGKGDIATQLEITCDNLELIYFQTIKNEEKRKELFTHGNGKVFIRNASDYEPAFDYVSSRFPEVSESLVYLRSDICRRELLVEIEMAFHSAP